MDDNILPYFHTFISIIDCFESNSIEIKGRNFLIFLLKGYVREHQRIFRANPSIFLLSVFNLFIQILSCLIVLIGAI